MGCEGVALLRVTAWSARVDTGVASLGSSPTLGQSKGGPDSPNNVHRQIV